MECVCSEKTVPIEVWTPRVEKILDSGNETISNIIIDETGAFSFYVLGGDKENPESLESGLYQIDLNVTGINDVIGFTEKKISAVPSDANFINDVKFKGKPTNERIQYTFNLTKDDDNQWSYLKSAKLIIKPIMIDNSSSGLDIEESNWVYADESIKFQFPLDLNKEEKDGSIPIYKKYLPNGEYDVWCVAEDLLGNTTQNENITKTKITWKYDSIGDIDCEIYNKGDVLYTTVRENNLNKKIYRILGDFSSSNSKYLILSKKTVDDDHCLITWDVTNYSEMDKI